MRSIAITTLVLAGALLSAAPAGAQSSPAPAAPPASPVAAASAPPGLTADAQAIYKQLVQNKLDRSRFTEAASAGLTDDVVGSLSKRFSPLGTPAWEFVKTIDTPRGPIAVYKLTYPSPSTLVLYMTIGETDKHTVWDLTFSKAPVG
jgi:hypothetical protein